MHKQKYHKKVDARWIALEYTINWLITASKNSVIITVYVLVSVVASFPAFHKFQVQPVFSCLLGDMLFHS